MSRESVESYSMHSRFAMLEPVAREWAVAALSVLEKTQGIINACDEYWTRTSSERMQRLCRNRFVYDPKRWPWAQVPQWRDLAQAFAVEPELTPIRNRFVGAPPFVFYCTLDRVAQMLIPVDYAEEPAVERLVFDEAQFRDRILDLQRLVDENEIELEYWTPIWNFVASESITLDEATRIDVMNDETLQHALRTGAIVGDAPSGRSYRQLPQNQWGLHTKVRTSKFVSSPLITSPSQLAEGHERADVPDAERLLDTLCLTGSGRVALGGTMSRCTFGPPIGFQMVWFGGWATSGLNAGVLSRSPVTIEGEHVGQLQQSWRLATQSKPGGDVELALRHLRFTFRRDRDEERILDLAIAAEALLLTKADDIGEIRFRVALHAAHYVGASNKERERIYDVVGKAYDARSVVAHGSDLRLWAARKKIDLTKLIDDFQAVIRECIVRRLSGQPDRVDWIALVVGE